MASPDYCDFKFYESTGDAQECFFREERIKQCTPCMLNEILLELKKITNILEERKE